LIAVRKLFAIITVVILLAGGAGAAAAWVAWGRLHEPYKGYSGSRQFVTIPQGAGSAEIGRRLADAHVISDPRIFRAAVWWGGTGRSLKAGEYLFDRPLNAMEVSDLLARGEVYETRITFPEGLDIEEMSRIYESQGFGPARDFVEATHDVRAIADLDPAATDLEGYLFPETYSLPHGQPASTLIGVMVGRFRTVYDRARAGEQDLTSRQIVTLASLIEKETAKPEERPLVSAVYRNRLKIGMPMQADPTIVYALAKARRYDGNIRREDLNLASPYNTYRHPGLPPGPIASPGRASLEAALAPADVPYLYFVSRNDGSHAFARTLAEHAGNVRKFQVEYFRTQSGGRGKGEGGKAMSGKTP
jgi:UPF0755 protein